MEDLAVSWPARCTARWTSASWPKRLKNQGIEHVEHHEQRLWQWWPLLG